MILTPITTKNGDINTSTSNTITNNHQTNIMSLIINQAFVPGAENCNQCMFLCIRWVWARAHEEQKQLANCLESHWPSDIHNAHLISLALFINICRKLANILIYHIILMVLCNFFPIRYR